MKTIRYELDADGIATLTFDEPGSPVNTMCARVAARPRRGHGAGRPTDKDAIQGIVLASAKTTFFAGADLKGTDAPDRPRTRAAVFARDRGR